jgi:putative transposase
MSRPLRIEFSGALYHVMARGNAREDIFRNDTDRLHFLSCLGAVCERFDWQVWAYCLMDNHYRLLVETRRATLSRGMREVNGIYTQAFNRRHGRVGHVLQGRYKSVLIDKDAYLQEVSRYIVLNPVRARLCANAGDWEWSSYRAVMGKAPAEDWLAVADTLAIFGSAPGPARRAYARFVAEGASRDDLMDEVTTQVFLGDEAFVAKAMKQAKGAMREVPKRQRARKSLLAYEREATERNAAIRAAYASGAYSLQAIGDHFGLHYATISRLVREGDV